MQITRVVDARQHVRVPRARWRLDPVGAVSGIGDARVCSELREWREGRVRGSGAFGMGLLLDMASGWTRDRLVYVPRSPRCRRSRRWPGVLTAAALALGALGAEVPHGGAATAKAPLAVSISPASGPAGTSIQVTGERCPKRAWDKSLDWVVHVQIGPAGSMTPATVLPPKTLFGSDVAFNSNGWPGRADVEVTANAKGKWSADIIPGSQRYAALPGTYPVNVLCFAREGTQAGVLTYASQSFEVTTG
jgi:hypothetical protein